MVQNATQRSRPAPDRILEPRKVLVSLLLGYVGFLGAFFGFRFSVPPLTLSILWSYCFPLIAGMAYGARYGFIAGLCGFGALYPFFLWPTNGWANGVTAALVLLWFTWHGYCAKRRDLKPALWNHPFVTQVLFAIIYATGTRYGYPPAMAANPPTWAPEALPSVPIEVLNSLVAKGTLNLFLAFFVALCALISPEVRRPLRLPIPAHARDNGKIVLVSVLAAFGLWSTLLLANSIFIELTFPEGAFSITTPYEIIALVMFTAAGLMTGYVIAQYVEMRQKASAALFTSEERFRGIFEHSPVGIAIVNTGDQSFVQVNQHFLDIIGYTEEELRQLTVANITHPEDWQLETPQIRERLENLTADYEIEKRYVRKDGGVRWVRVIGELLHLNADQPRIALASVIDITAQREAAEALRTSEIRYRNTFEQAAVGISHAALDGRLLRVNDRLCDITGYPRETLLTMRFQDITHPDDLAMDLELSERLIAGEIETFQREKRYIHRSGDLVWVGITASLMRDEIGAPMYFISVIEDITTRKQAEEALARQRILLRTVIENLPDAVYVKDLALRKVLANRADLKNMGLSNEAEALGKTDFEVFPPEIAEAFMRDDRAVLESDTPIFDREERLVQDTGEERWLVTSKMPLRDDQGKIIGIVGIGHDITERKHSEEALRQSNQNLSAALTELQQTQQRMVQQERLAAVGQLAAGIAHDFNNILAIIVLYTQMSLQTPALQEPIAGRLQIILQQAKRAAELIRQIVDFGRRTMLERHPLDLLPFMQEQLVLLRRTLPENIRIELHAAEAEYIVHADPTRLQQTLFNLAVNARDAMPEGGVLRIGLEHLIVQQRQERPPLETGLWIKVTVADTGTGMPPEVVAHLFEPFFTTKPPGKGSGLGLAQVHGIVKQHQGEIEVSSRLGEGSVFTIYLPSSAVDVANTAAMMLESAHLGNGEHVLVVEDDPGVRAALVSILETLNYHPLEAMHGHEALEILTQHADEIALVLSDFVMPQLGGQGLLEAIRQRGLSQPVIILSGYPLQSELTELHALGLTDWLLKPPDVEQLARAITQALRQR